MTDCLLHLSPKPGEDKHESVMGRTGLSCAMIYKLIKAGEFPAPIKAGRSSLWPESEVDAWIEARKAERGKNSA